MKYALVILAVLIQGILSKNCTRTNTKKNFCVKSCNPSLNNPCKGNRACLCDGDCGYSCVRTDRRCPKLRIENGRIRGARNTSFGSVIKYRCNGGYLLKGPRKRTCRGNANWDGETPVCKATCGDPGNIPHGRKQGNNYESGKKVKYTCPLGFIMQGNSTLTCLDNGRWNRDKPKCVCQRTNKKAYRYCKKSCNPERSNCNKQSECVCDGDCGYSCVAKGSTCNRPVQIDNGNRQYTSHKFGSTVRYRCNKPYSLIGAETRTCRGIRRWDGIDPVCKIICQDPGDITHGSKQVFRRNYDEDYSIVGDRVEYNCFPNYKMEGSKQLICTKNGKWSGAKPKCTVPTCKPPQRPPNAELHRRFQSGRTSYNYKERVVFQCKTGYFSRGIGVKTCDSDGWTGRSFACSPKTCGHPGRPENGRIKSYVFTFKSKVHFVCNYKYKLDGDQFRQCQSNQKWSGRVPKCKLIDCGPLSTPFGASKVHETHTNVDGVVRFKCTEKGYELKGSEIRTCLNTGLWSGTTTTCKIVSCADPGSPTDGKKVNAKSKYNYGDTLQFACNVNFTLQGNPLIKCEETKDWSGAVPYCRAPCSDPGVPNKGNRIDQDFRHGHTVRFTCLTNYVINGLAKITCTDGQWDGDRPSCKAPCSDPEIPRNGKRSGKDFRHNRSVTFTCNTGFELKGNASITCLDGRWSGSKPQCEVISCADPGSPANGKIVSAAKNKYNYGDTLQFACNVNYTLEGDRQINCQETTHWSGAVPNCRATCSDPGIPGKGIRIGEAFSHKQSVRFTCHPGFELKGNEVMTCLDGRWNGSRPQCKVCSVGNALGMNSKVIADSSIRASSQTSQHPAHHGRLGGDRFWCSQPKENKYIEIDLPKRYKITKVEIDVQKSVNSGPVNLYIRVLKKWIRVHREPRTKKVSVGYHEIVPSEPFMAKNIRIFVGTAKRRQFDSLCLKTEIYGCFVPRAMPPKKRSYQTRSANLAKRPRLSHGTESRQVSRQEDSSQQLVPTQEQLMTVNVTALSATISSAVKQAVVEALAERTQPSSSHSPEAPIAEQFVAEAVGASLASITQGTPQSYVNGLTLADPGQGSQVPKQTFSSIAVSLSSRVSSKIKAKIWSNEYLNFGTLLSLSPNNQKYSITVASTDSESSRPHLTLEPSQPAKKVQSITQWLSAFNIFVAIYAEKQATDTPKLMKYCEIVRDIAAKPGDWLYYDEQFRFIRQSAPDQYPWDAIHWELWLKAVTNFRPKPQFPADKGHLRTRPQSFPKGTCWRFHAGRVCNGCRFDHICFKCGSPHPATQCSSGQQHKGNPIKVSSTIAAPQAGNTRKGGSA